MASIAVTYRFLNGSEIAPGATQNFIDIINGLTDGTKDITIGTLTATNFSGSSSGTNTGDVTIGTFGSSPTAKGISISGQVITLQPADGTNAGALSTGIQTIAGAKTFSGVGLFSSRLSIGSAFSPGALYINVGVVDTSTTTYAVVLDQPFPATTTATAYGFTSFATTAAASYTLSALYYSYANNQTKGAGSTIARMVHYGGAFPTQGTTGNAFLSDNISFSGNYVLNFSSTNESLLSGDLRLATAGKGLLVKEGTNAKMGVATLAGGTVIVSTTAVTANTRIFLTTDAPGGTLGAVYVSTRTAGTSFTISSLNALDTSTVAWILFEPA